MQLAFTIHFYRKKVRVRLMMWTGVEIIFSSSSVHLKVLLMRKIHSQVSAELVGNKEI